MAGCNRFARKQISAFSILFLVLLGVHICCGQEKNSDFCSASENMKWNIRKEKCVKCSDCEPGLFRNLTEQYVGPSSQQGDLKCLPCRKCPEGKYSKDGVDCIFCKQNCTDLNREYDETCSRTHDAKCGSCISGFEDSYHDTNFPCSPKSASSKLTSEDITLPVRKQSEKDDKTIDNEENNRPNNPVPSSMTTISVILISSGSVTVVSFVAVGSVAYIKKSRTTSRSSGVPRSSNLSHDNDIEMDCLFTDPGDDSENTITKQKYQPLPQTNTDRVRAELASGNIPGARGELSRPETTESPPGFIYYKLPEGLYYIEDYQRNKTICPCEHTKKCSCWSYQECLNDIDVTMSDMYIRETASNICHDPTELFRNLGLDYSVIYQENDTRNRDPVKITQKELVIQLLNIWIQRSKTPPKLSTLLKALCATKFHTICDKLKALGVHSDRINAVLEEKDNASAVWERNYANDVPLQQNAQRDEIDNETVHCENSDSVSLFDPSV